MFVHKHPEMDDHQHATVDDARECEDRFDEAKQEHLDELRYEQHFENRGWWEAFAQEEYDLLHAW
jgi:hypothetical protein